MILLVADKVVGLIFFAGVAVLCLLAAVAALGAGDSEGDR